MLYCQDGNTPLHLAIVNKLNDAIKTMLEMPAITPVLAMQDKVSEKRLYS
jgi:ankyrin repeat protein